MREPTDPIRETPAQAVREARTGGYFGRDLPRNLAVAAAIGALLAYLAPFGMDAAPFVRRLLYWVPLMVAGALLGGAISAAAGRIRGVAERPWVHGAIIAAGITAAGAGLIWGYSYLFFGAGFIPMEAIPSFLGSVFVIAAAMTALMIAINRPGPQTHAAAPGAAPVRFLERLPAKLKGAALYAVQAEDHYLRLHTSKGGDLILMRLADAISELEGLEGAQTHRSWWVAKDAVESAERDGPRVTLKLKGGVAAPVSRPNVSPLREAGWF